MKGESPTPRSQLGPAQVPNFQQSSKLKSLKWSKGSVDPCDCAHPHFPWLSRSAGQDLHHKKWTECISTGMKVRALCNLYNQEPFPQSHAGDQFTISIAYIFLCPPPPTKPIAGNAGVNSHLSKGHSVCNQPEQDCAPTAVSAILDLLSRQGPSRQPYNHFSSSSLLRTPLLTSTQEKDPFSSIITETTTQRRAAIAKILMTAYK